jgi:hypothetical protein
MIEQVRYFKKDRGKEHYNGGDNEVDESGGASFR